MCGHCTWPQNHLYVTHPPSIHLAQRHKLPGGEQPVFTAACQQRTHGLHGPATRAGPEARQFSKAKGTQGGHRTPQGLGSTTEWPCASPSEQPRAGRATAEPQGCGPGRHRPSRLKMAAGKHLPHRQRLPAAIFRGKKAWDACDRRRWEGESSRRRAQLPARPAWRRHPHPPAGGRCATPAAASAPQPSPTPFFPAGSGVRRRRARPRQHPRGHAPRRRPRAATRRRRQLRRLPAAPACARSRRRSRRGLRAGSVPGLAEGVVSPSPAPAPSVSADPASSGPLRLGRRLLLPRSLSLL